ncbi:cation:proton antiporter [Noviherbaspirillum galbum]|uniref:Sodium:proton antiporter n=1 Tax=Noviherbaspirillum galbum TaxID=2709383 RepID=A0A6B3SMI3_9BURK|nr:sodium:proton antiporter [Noviherbaspirillum galbum]NEX62064.1 sodium:proton antiporter [Noviherbaspirillum galbum]
MHTSDWFLLIGLLMLTRGLAVSLLERLPFTSAILYLAVGLVLGPSVLNLFYFDPLKNAKWLEILAEVAALISLFSAGVKMPVPFSLRRWMPPIRLAWVSMTITVGLVAAFGFYVLGLPLGAGVLLGAILAPTDPVLATDVQSRHPGDNDRLRFTLTSEAGMNDGTAFPFVMLGLGLLGLHEIGELGWQWALREVLWATLGAILVGVACGAIVARIVWKLRGQQRKHDVLDDLVGLGMIAIVYGISLELKTWGFLAVFFAAVALRQTELNLATASGVKPEKLNADVAEPAAVENRKEDAPPPIVSAESLVFKEHLERLSELMLVFLLGGMLFVPFWNWRTVSLGLFLFFIARPLSVWLGMLGSKTSLRIRGIAGWFGVRGIGSMYYLMFAINHGLQEALAEDLAHLTLIVITMSILVHGVSVKPLMNRLWEPSEESASSEGKR